MHQTLAPSISSVALVQVLIAGVEVLADIRYAPMPDAVRMRHRPGRRPTVWLDPGAPDEHLRHGLMGVLRVLSGDPVEDTGGTTLRPRTHLRAVP